MSAFTLIELLVVIAIMGLLSSVVFASLNSARAKARDARRIQDMQQLQRALELYYADKGHYPKIAHALSYDTGCTTVAGCGHCNRWCALQTQLRPYLPVVPREPRGDSSAYYYIYYGTPSNGYTSYGIAAKMESSWGKSLAANDGGYYAHWYELGEDPPYCMRTYAGGGRDWVCRGCSNGNWGWRCRGGN